MKLLKKLLLTFLVINSYITHPEEEELEKNLTNVETTANSGNESLPLSYVPQFQDYSSYIPKPIMNILGKLNLTNVEVQYDPDVNIGALSAKTNLLGTQGIVRIMVGQSLSSTTTFHDAFKLKLKKYQNQLKSAATTAQKSTTWIKQGLTYVSPSVSSSNSKETKQALINEALKTKKTESQKQEPAEQPSTKSSNWVSEQLSSYQAGILLILPKGFKFASLSKDLSFLDFIDFEEIIFGISEGFTDPIYGSIPQGFSLIAKVNSDMEPFKTITSFLNKIPGPAKLSLNQPFTLRGGITLGLGGSSFDFLLPGQITLNITDKKIAETDQLSVDVTLLPMLEGNWGVSGLSAGLAGGLTLYLNNIDDRLNPLDFSIAFAFDSSAEVSLSGIMDGLLNLQPIGLPLEFGNITLTIGLNPENTEILGLSELGMMGSLEFGPPDSLSEITAAIDVKVSGQNTNILVYGDLEPVGRKKDALTIKDIVYLATTAFRSLSSDIDKFTSTIPDLGVKKATFYFSPRNTIFANKLWKAGAKVDLEIDILGEQAKLQCDIDSEGFDAVGFLSEVDLGPIKLTGAGENRKCIFLDSCLQSCDSKTEGKQITITDPHVTPKITSGFELTDENVPQVLKDWPDYSKLQGPIVNLRFRPPTDIGLFISGEIDVNAGNLGSFKTDACFDISLKGVTAHFEAQAFNVFDTTFTLKAQDFLKPKDWYLCAELKQDALTLIEQEISKLVDSAKEGLSQKLNDAKNKVSAAEKAYQDAFRTAQSGIDSAQEKVNSLKKQLDDAKDKCSGHSSSSNEEPNAYPYGYPYQQPHQFNPNYVQPNYVFLGDLTIYGGQFYNINIKNKTIGLRSGIPHSLLNDFVGSSSDIKNFVNDSNNPLVLRSGKSLSTRLVPVGQGKSISIFMQNINNIITIYVWDNKSWKDGYKIIFDTQKFSDYVTQSYWYDHLPSKQVFGFAFGLAINGDNLNPLAPMNIIPGLGRLINISVLQPAAQSQLKLYDITLYPKIGGRYLTVPMSYDDLLFTAQKSIEVQPLDQRDFNTLYIKGIR